MKKLESTWYNMAVVLTLIAVLAGFALAYVNSITAPTIEQIKEQQKAEAKSKVLNGQKGYAVEVSDPNGFGGTLTVMVGVADDGTILGYEILETQETPGLGAKAQDWFQKGQPGDIIGKKAGQLKVKKDNGEVDAITASTITSRAFLRCINQAVASDANTSATSQADGKKCSGAKNTNDKQ